MPTAVVLLRDGTVASITLDKYLASRMTILEECSEDELAEKLIYWDNILNPKPEPKMYHFYNAKRNRHIWTIYSDINQVPGIRHRQEYIYLTN